MLTTAALKLGDRSKPPLKKKAKGPTTADEYRASGLPRAYHNNITFYHTFVKGDGAGTDNPLNVLLKECKPRDYCVVKVDGCVWTHA